MKKPVCNVCHARPLEPLIIETNHLQVLGFPVYYFFFLFFFLSFLTQLLLRRETLTGAGGYCLALRLGIKLEHLPGAIYICIVHACTCASYQHLGPHHIIYSVARTHLVSVHLRFTMVEK